MPVLAGALEHGRSSKLQLSNHRYQFAGDAGWLPDRTAANRWDSPVPRRSAAAVIAAAVVPSGERRDETRRQDLVLHPRPTRLQTFHKTSWAEIVRQCCCRHRVEYATRKFAGTCDIIRAAYKLSKRGRSGHRAAFSGGTSTDSGSNSGADRRRTDNATGYRTPVNRQNSLMGRANRNQSDGTQRQAADR